MKNLWKGIPHELAFTSFRMKIPPRLVGEGAGGEVFSEEPF